MCRCVLSATPFFGRYEGTKRQTTSLLDKLTNVHMYIYIYIVHMCLSVHMNMYKHLLRGNVHAGWDLPGGLGPSPAGGPQAPGDAAWPSLAGVKVVPRFVSFLLFVWFFFAFLAGGGEAFLFFLSFFSGGGGPTTRGPCSLCVGRSTKRGLGARCLGNWIKSLHVSWSRCLNVA